MKKHILSILIFAVSVSILTLTIVLVSRYNKPTIPVQAESETKAKTSAFNNKTYSVKEIVKELSSVFSTEIKEDLISSLSPSALSALSKAISENAISEASLKTATGYTKNAFVDKFSGGNSRDMGFNNKDSFVLGFTGDINFTPSGYVMTHARNMPNSVLDCIDETFQNEMKSADIMLVNNEFPYSDRGSPLQDKKYTFCASPDTVKYMTAMGVDIVSLANNHAYDYGLDAFCDTLDTLKGADIKYVGAGMNYAECSAPVTFLINGYKIAYLACSGVEYPIKTVLATDTTAGIMGSYDSGEKMALAIKKARADCDYVIVFPHWGIENTTELTNAQISNSRKWIDAGADAVIGAHPHCLQGMDFYNDAPVIYSLGNFWFNTRDVYTGLLKLEISSSGIKTVFVPGRQANSETHYLDSQEERRQLYNKIEGWPGSNITITDDGEITKK